MKASIFILSLMMIMSNDIYEFRIKSIDGEEISFSQFKGKSLLLVNVASKCWYTPQYADLEKLHEDFGHKVVVVGFPANNFGSQEPGTNEEIATFCERNYGVKFLMSEKISVKGSDQHPLYKLLKEKTGKDPSWNFCKYLVKPDGTVQFFSSDVKPLSDEIVGQL